MDKTHYGYCNSTVIDIRYYMEHLGFKNSALKRINGNVIRGFQK